MVVELPPDLGVMEDRCGKSVTNCQLFVYYLTVINIYVLIVLFSDLQHCFSTCFTIDDYYLGMECTGAHCGPSGAELCVQVRISEDL
jgi:hypothetical protein